MNEVEDIVHPDDDDEDGSVSNRTKDHDNQTQDSNTGNAVANAQYWMLALQTMRQSPPPTSIVRELLAQLQTPTRQIPPPPRPDLQLRLPAPRNDLKHLAADDPALPPADQFGSIEFAINPYAPHPQPRTSNAPADPDKTDA